MQMGNDGMMVTRKLQTAVHCAILTSLLLLTRGATGEQPTPQAIAAYAASCKATGKAMDLIATFGTDFSDLDLRGVNLRAMRLVGANFQNANLHSANLANCDLEQADFTDADLTDANFSGASVKAAVFQRAVGLADSERRRLLTEARRGEFEFRRGITGFLNSVWFPIGLFVAVPVVAVATGVLRKRIRRVPEKPASSPRFQFSLVSLLSVTLAIGLFFGLASWSASGAFSYVAACAGYMMTLELVYGRVSWLWRWGTL